MEPLEDPPEAPTLVTLNPKTLNPKPLNPCKLEVLQNHRPGPGRDAETCGGTGVDFSGSGPLGRPEQVELGSTGAQTFATLNPKPLNPKPSGPPLPALLRAPSRRVFYWGIFILTLLCCGILSFDSYVG